MRIDEPPAEYWKGPASRGRVLVVDDDPEVRRVIVNLLEDDGYRTSEAATAGEMAKSITNSRPDLILLDVMLQGEDGFEVLATLRRSNDLPVILLTGKVQETDRVLGLRLGADDYIVKPFSGPELVARVATVLRRYSQPRVAQAILDFGELYIDTLSREVVLRGTSVDTTAKEFDLLAFLATSPRQVFTREQLLEHVWGSSTAWQDGGTVTEHVRRLRQKLVREGRSDGWIRTVRGIGYRFEP